MKSKKILEFFHRDPFDRLLVAQCLELDANLLSTDSVFDSYFCDCGSKKSLLIFLMSTSITGHLIELILSADICIEQRLAYGIPFFYYLQKPICYVNKHKDESVDLGFCHGAELNLLDIFPDARNEKVIMVKNFSSFHEIENLTNEIIAALSAEIDFIKQKKSASR